MAVNLIRRHTQVNYGTTPALAEDSRRGQKRLLDPSEASSDRSEKIQRLHQEIRVLDAPALSPKAGIPWLCLDRQFIQNGVTVCHGKMYAQQQVAVKKQQGQVEDLQRLISHSHEHLVKIFDVFFEDEIVYLVYEYMDVSIRNIASLPMQLAAREISMICKAICSGLSYIHNALQISLGNLDGSKVLINRTGIVKIASIGDALLENRPLKDAAADIYSVGLIMVELMDHTASVVFPNELKIRDPKLWEKDGNILAFLADTQTSQLAELLAHDFMPKTTDYSRLSYLVILAQMNAYIRTECIVPEAKPL